MIRMFRFSIVILVVVAAILACSRQNPEYIGPAYVSAPEGFTIDSFTVSRTSVNFKTQDVIFNAGFSSAVSWTLTIIGKESGAVHTVSGISKGFGNEVWKGSHDGLFFFRVNERARATLSFFGSSITSSHEILITRDVDLTTCGSYFPKFGDFEQPTRVNPPGGTGNWAAFNNPTAIPGVEQGADSAKYDFNGKKVEAVQGRCYYYIRGIGNTPNYISGLQYTTSIIGALPADPDQVWVNIYLYGTGDPNANVDLEYQEADLSQGDTGYDPNVDDAFVAHVPLTHKGWKLFSFKYSDLVVSTNGFGSNGNKFREPDRLRSFDVVLSKKSIPTSPVEVYFDYPIFTVGGPFKPCK